LVTTLPGPTVAVQPDGTFVFENVVPGNYAVYMPPLNNVTAILDRSVSQEFARTPVTIEGDLSGLVVTTTPGATVRGRFVFDVGTPPASLRRELLRMSATFVGDTGPRSPGVSTSNADGTFQIERVAGRGALRLESVLGFSGWFLKSITLNGKDVTDAVFDFSSGEIKDLEVLVTQKQSDVRGVVVDRRNAAVTDYVAVIFPEDKNNRTPQSRFIAAGRPDQQGRFSVKGLPPARYLAVAVPFLEGGEERDPALLDRLEKDAVLFTLGENEIRSVNLTLVP
jgi:hypothetical protein